MEARFFDLLKQWCDRLLTLQVTDMGDPHFDGAFLCPACLHIHGRSADAIYPLMAMADMTGEKAYLEAAKRLFVWGENMMCDDGSIYNDAQKVWNGITVFSSIALCEALERHGHLLDSETRAAWEARLMTMSEWLYTSLDEHTDTNVNYPVTNSAALAMIGHYFHNDAYVQKAGHLAAFAMTHFTENGLLWGEGHPQNLVTPKGCRPIDMGYNVEESVPSLVKYALQVNDETMIDKLVTVLEQQLAFMMGDGAWDNSFGTRNNKWTWWGSRTSDGAAAAYAMLAHKHPLFAEAARRNVELLASCTHDGLLHGGPHYHLHGEAPCVHHTFCHANALALALAHSDKFPAKRTSLPVDTVQGARYFPEIDTYKIACGDYRYTLTAYDFGVKAGMHASGGTVSLMWHKTQGPLLLSSVVDYVLVEDLNMQLSRQKASHRTLTPRFVLQKDGKTYTNAYDDKATITPLQNGAYAVSARLQTAAHEFPENAALAIRYTFSDDGLTVTASHLPDGCRLILPLIAGCIQITAGTVEKKDDIFFLTGGFMAKEHTVAPDEDGSINLTVSANA